MGAFDDINQIRKNLQDNLAKQQADKAAADAAASKAKQAPIQASADATQSKLSSIQAPTPLTLEDPSKAYQQSDASKAMYSTAQNNLKSTLSQARSQSQDALQRRLAALGNLNSGAGIKQVENLDSDLARQEADANLNLSTQQAQSEEAKGFQASQAAQGRNFAREQYNAGIPFQFGQFQFDAQSKMAQLGLQGAQFGMSQDAFDWQKQIDEYNKKLGAYQAGHSGGLLGGGGFLGTGIGAGSADIG
jgi:hypothetical protein